MDSRDDPFRPGTAGSAEPHAAAPPFRVEVRPQREAVHVCPVGEVDLATVGDVQKQLDELRAAGFSRVVLDLRDVTFLDSTGLRLVAEATQASRADGWEFAIMDGPPAVRRVFEISGLRPLLTIADPASPAPVQKQA